MTQPVSMDPFKAAPFAAYRRTICVTAPVVSMMRSCDPCKPPFGLARGTAVMQVSRLLRRHPGNGESFGAIAFAVGNHDLANRQSISSCSLATSACPQAEATSMVRTAKSTATSGAGVAGRQKALHLVSGQSFGNPVNRRPGTVGTQISDRSIAPST